MMSTEGKPTKAGKAAPPSYDKLGVSEELHQLLFESMDEGFCIVEVLFDESGRAEDYRFLETNAVFETQTGLKNALGHRMRELEPQHEEHWFEIYGDVARTGESRRFEHRAQRLGDRWFEVIAFRVGEPEQRRVGILFNDITRRKRVEANHVFLSAVRDEFARQETAQVMPLLCRKIVEHLGLLSCVFIEVDEPVRQALVTYGWSRALDGEVPSMPYRIPDFASEQFYLRARDGTPMVVPDTWTHPHINRKAFEQNDVRSLVAAPCVSDGQWRSLLVVSDTKPRDWREDEIELITELTARLWTNLERARATEELKAKEKELDAVLNRTPFMLTRCSRDLRYRFVSPAYGAMLKRSPDELVGQFIVEIMGDAAFATIKPFIDRVLQGETVEYESPVPLADGTAPRLRVQYVPDRDEQGQVIGWFASMVDVTERYEIENALRESQERLLLIIENAREYAIFSMDLDRRITTWHSGAHAILGYAEEEAIGQSGDIIFTPEDRAAGIPGREAQKAVEEGRATDERWHVCKDGRRFWGSGVMTAMHDEHGMVVGLLKIFRDQTEQREAKEALEKSLRETELARAEAEVSARAKDHFLAVLSHELRTPLTPVLMAVEALMEDHGIPAYAREDLRMMKRNIELETALIDDLLDLSRVSSGKLKLSIQPVDLNDAVRHVKAICDGRQHEARMHLSLDPKAGLVLADASRLQQVLWNVLKNALKFTPAEGDVCISTARLSSDRCEVRIADTGIGIRPDVLERIFDAFEQGGTEVTRRFGGMGLGLAICKGLLQLQNGTIRAESGGHGQGACFIIELPSAPMTATLEKNSPAVLAASMAGRHLRVLVVEDHCDTAATLGRLLKNAGFEVIVAGSVGEGKAVLSSGPIDILISDLGLPDGSGCEVMSLANSLGIPGVAMSGFGMDDDLSRSLAAGFSEHLTKPVEFATLRASLERIAAGLPPRS